MKNKGTMNEIENIGALLNKTFTKNAWHGPSVQEVLKDVDADIAKQRLNNTHSIIELVSHMTSWRIYVLHKLKGETFKMTEEFNFPSESNWHVALQQLEKSQTDLLKAVENFPVKKLHEIVPSANHEYTFYTLLHGIIHHDLYHAGQIMIIKNILVCNESSAKPI